LTMICLNQLVKYCSFMFWWLNIEWQIIAVDPW
jgi:hypothetical protein